MFFSACATVRELQITEVVMTLQKYPKATALKDWLSQATKEMKDELAILAGTSTSMYRQWVDGRRAISADMAGRLSSASREVAALYLEKHGAVNLPDSLTRGDLCEACRKCEYFQNRDLE
jgi:DNA-binding transcriptional regulator YdaS (Cro superfamily)